MLRTTYLNLKKPEGSDPVNVQDFNDNADTIDTEVNARVKSSGGDIANTKVSAYTASTASYPVPAAGETPKVFMGKIKKFFEDIRNATTGACFIGQIINNCVTDNAKLPLSAAQGKELMDLYTVLNSNLDNITSANTLLYTFKYLPPSFLDNPNNHFKVSGWTAVPYLSLSNIANGAGWGVILGIYDNNNGTPLGRQFVIGTSKVATRRYVGGSWTVWE